MSKTTKTVRSQSSGTKTTRKKASSTTGRKKTSLNSSAGAPSVKTQKNLEKNLKKITTTPKAKAKTTSKRRTKKPLELKVMNSRKIELFPWVNTFPYFLQDLTENKRCWFQCEDHVEKYVNRYNCKYKLYHYTGNASNRDQN